MSETEQQIIRKAAAGDRMAFRQLVLDHSHAMYRLAWRLTCDQNAADDIVQEAFIKVWKKLGDFRMESGFRAWLHRITVNTAMDYLRKRSTRQRFETEEPQVERVVPDAAGARPETQIDIRRQTRLAMQGLSENERAALMLKHYEGHSINEIAQMLELTTGACKQTIFRAVRKMRIALKPLVTA
jgi:RNA polymerase sigma-70 factor (ECF subfamily)